MGDWTFSKAEQLLACGYAFRADVTVPEDATPNEARDKGNDVHRAAAARINGGEMPEMLTSPGYSTWANLDAWIKANRKPSWVAEPAYAWDPEGDTARILGVDIDRQYERHGKKPHEQAGTCDVVSVEGDTVYVYEWGTGYDVDHKAEQLRICCAVAAKAHGCARAVGQLVQVRDEGAYPRRPVEYGRFELAAIEEEFAARLREVPGSKATPGPHCGRCNAVSVCPETQLATEALVPEGALVRRFTTEIQGPDHAVWMAERVKLIEKACAQVKAALKAACPADGWRAADGTLVKVSAGSTRETLNQAAAVALLMAKGATPEEIQGLYRTSTTEGSLKVYPPKARKDAA